MKTKLIQAIPVLPSADIGRDVNWYQEKVGFVYQGGDDMYAILQREGIFIHLQWHADTEDDPLLGGSVVKFFVEGIEAIFEELVQRKTVEKDKLRLNTPWNTNEFGFFDLNQNAVFFVESI